MHLILVFMETSTGDVSTIQSIQKPLNPNNLSSIKLNLDQKIQGQTPDAHHPTQRATKLLLKPIRCREKPLVSLFTLLLMMKHCPALLKLP